MSWQETSAVVGRAVGEEAEVAAVLDPRIAAEVVDRSLSLEQVAPARRTAAAG